MAELTRQQLVELITAEVLRITGVSPEPEPVDKSGCPKALVIGPVELLPAGYGDKYQLMGIEDYKTCGDIEPYEKVFITKLSLTELSDIALGRDSRPAQCAVVNALLYGKEILLFECALPHRKLAGRGSRGFYQMLEGYARTLQSFGIILVQGQNPLAKYDPAVNLPGKVVTEAVARSLLEKPGDVILLPKGAVITPSARDVFLHGGKRVETI